VNGNKLIKQGHGLKIRPNLMKCMSLICSCFLSTHLQITLNSFSAQYGMETLQVTSLRKTLSSSP